MNNYTTTNAKAQKPLTVEEIRNAYFDLMLKPLFKGKPILVPREELSMSDMGILRKTTDYKIVWQADS